MMLNLVLNELQSGDMQVVFINECKSYEISNQMFFNVILSFSKTTDKHKYCKIKLISGTFLHGHLMNQNCI